MTTTEAVNETLDSMYSGQEFTGLSLQQIVAYKTDREPFPSTCLRMMRYWRSKDHRKVICINRRRSQYKMVVIR